MWKLQYIDLNKGSDSFFGQYGSCCHKVLEKFAKGEINIFNISQEYNRLFNKFVKEKAPFNKYTDLRKSYYKKGLQYFDNIDLDLSKYNILGIEKRVTFEIEGKKFVGCIDLLVEEKETGDILIIDHKQKNLRMLKGGEISKTCEEELEGFRHQLYLYAIPIIEEYKGKKIKLCWNLYNNRAWYQEEFDQKKYEDSKKWAIGEIDKIVNETEWLPNNSNEFFCRNLCSMRDCACEYKK